jgi:hypothetical protein
MRSELCHVDAQTSGIPMCRVGAVDPCHNIWTCWRSQGPRASDPLDHSLHSLSVVGGFDACHCGNALVLVRSMSF